MKWAWSAAAASQQGGRRFDSQSHGSGPFCMEFACFGSSGFPPQSERRARQANWQLYTTRGCDCGWLLVLLCVHGMKWRLVQGVTPQPGWTPALESRTAALGDEALRRICFSLKQLGVKSSEEDRFLSRSKQVLMLKTVLIVLHG